MNMTLNETYLKARLRRAGLLQAIGLTLVVVSFVFSLLMTAAYWLVFVSYPMLIAGFPLWQYGRGQVRYWRAMQKVPPAMLEEARPGPKQHIYAFLPVAGTMVDFLLVAPEGLLLIEMKGTTEGLVASGAGGATEYKTGGFAITCRQDAGADRWAQRLPILERLARLGEPALGNPSQSVEQKVAKLKEWLQTQAPVRTPVPVRGLVVFRNPKTPLEIERSTVEVVHLNELRSFLSLGQYFEEELRPVLSTDDRNRVNTALAGLLGSAAAKPVVVTSQAPARKISPAARAEQERVRAIRAERAAQAAAPPAVPAARKPDAERQRNGSSSTTYAPRRPGSPGGPDKGA